MTNSVRAIIFAQEPQSMQRLWGMTLLEKLIRQLSTSGVTHCDVVFKEETSLDAVLRDDFAQWNKIQVNAVVAGENELETIKTQTSELEGVALVFDGNTILDARIIDQLMERATSDGLVRIQTNEDSPRALALGVDLIKTSTESDLDTLLSSPGLVNILTSEMDSYIGSMRRRQEPFLFKIENAEQMKQAEKTAFTAIYKGATDFITKYAWPYPTRVMVHLISPTGITPNQITYFSMVLSFGAIPLFFIGHFWIAWVMGTIMSFLDTLDGKLARLTLRTSESGHWLDNASDTIYLWLWYAGIGWYFADDLLNFQDINTVAAWSLVGFFTIDKIITGLFKKLFGAQLHDFGPIDWYARIYIARRNPFLVVLLIGLLMGQPIFGLHAMAIWQTATFVFHMIRFIYLPLSGQKHQVHTR